MKPPRSHDQVAALPDRLTTSDRFALSFRAKLLLSMVLLVGGVSGTTLYSTRLILQRTYEEALQAQFRTHIAYFTERQTSRLKEIKEQCAQVADSEALRAALTQHDAAAAVAAARTGLTSAITASFRAASRTNNGGAAGPGAPAGGPAGFLPGDGRGPGSDGPPGGPPGGPSGVPPAGFPGGGPGSSPGPGRGGFQGAGQGRNPGGPGMMFGYLRVLDAEGNVLRAADSPGPAPRRGSAEREKAFDDQLAALNRSLSSWATQEVVYLAPTDNRPAPVLLEVVATRVTEPGTGKTLGAVVLGSPLFDRAEEMRDVSEIVSGIWLDGQLYTRTIPDALRVALIQGLKAETARTAGGAPSFVVAQHGESFRVLGRLLNPDSPFPRAYQVHLYSLASALRTQRDLQSVILSISLVVLLAAAGISLLLANTLTRSVRELSAATAEVLQGNFQVRVPVRSRDDVGRLVHSFNEMTGGLAQKDRYRRVLNLVADERIASQLLATEELPGAESRRVTVLFCDVRAFTVLTRDLPAGEVIRMLNEHMSLLAQVVREHQGFVDKFVGDLLMAVFGAPLSQGEDARQAVACARKMIAARADLNRTCGRPIEVGIGLATGTAIAGLLGSVDRANYTVIGDCVNLASRLCDRARPGQILLDSATRDQLADPGEATPVAPLVLKGYQEPVPAWELIGPTTMARPGA
ncbi:MAG: adenylate/guanylate cyclase domain-containing protein [Verrucomicrobiota bacterium]|jgi:class 3 adenylate cyclase